MVPVRVLRIVVVERHSKQDPNTYRLECTAGEGVMRLLFVVVVDVYKKARQTLTEGGLEVSKHETRK